MIRDGADTSSPVIGKYGSCVIGSLKLFSSGSSVLLQTEIEVFSVNDELKIAYRPIDPGKSASLIVITYCINIRKWLTKNIVHRSASLSASLSACLVVCPF